MNVWVPSDLQKIVNSRRRKDPYLSTIYINVSTGSKVSSFSYALAYRFTVVSRKKNLFCSLVLWTVICFPESHYHHFQRMKPFCCSTTAQPHNITFSTKETVLEYYRGLAENLPPIQRKQCSI